MEALLRETQQWNAEIWNESYRFLLQRCHVEADIRGCLDRSSTGRLVDELYELMELFACSTIRIHHVSLHDTGEHTDYFSAPYLKTLLTDETQRAKYILLRF